MSLVVTKAALALKKSDANFQLVKYEAHKPKGKHKKEPNDVNTKINKIDNSKDLDLKRIRHEVVKFGMQGFDGLKKEEAKIALAVSLGAKPPKREYVNYKELMKKRKEQKKKEIEEKEAMNAKSTMLRVGKSKKKKTNKGNDVGHFLQNYGKVQKKDIQKRDEKSSKKRNKK